MDTRSWRCALLTSAHRSAPGRPLALGAPRDPRNLWPQPLTATLPDGTAIGADEKDDLEDELKRRVCDGTAKLDEAQRAIAGDWVQVWIEAGRP